jgi:hypothetical protein
MMSAPEFRLTKKRVQAAALLAEDELSDEKISAMVGVARSTIAMWKLNPVFAAHVQSLVTAWENKVMTTGIANKVRRVRALNHLHGLQMQIVEERSENAALNARDETGKPLVPGGATGLVVIQQRPVGLEEGKPIIASEGVFDHGLSREIRATLEQAAKETGQFIERHELSAGDGRPVAISVQMIDDIGRRVRAARERDALRRATESPY